jgi:hypothetical protein
MTNRPIFSAGRQRPAESWAGLWQREALELFGRAVGRSDYRYLVGLLAFDPGSHDVSISGRATYKQIGEALAEIQNAWGLDRTFEEFIEQIDETWIVPELRDIFRRIAPDDAAVPKRKADLILRTLDRCLVLAVDELEGQGVLPGPNGLPVDPDGVPLGINAEPLPPPEVPARPEARAALAALTGLDGVKRAFDNLHALVAVSAARARHGHTPPPIALHAAFVGPPGTGKTTVARLYGQLLRELGLLKRPDAGGKRRGSASDDLSRAEASVPVIEVDRSLLVGAYVGHTEERTCEAFEAARGGVLLIDEAYALAGGGRCGTSDPDYGQRAIDVLVKLMEDHRDEVAVVMTGYPREMSRFLRSNPGLRSRVGRTLSFEPLSDRALVELFAQRAQAQGYRLDAALQPWLSRLFVAERQARKRSFGNARAARQLLEATLIAHAGRLLRTHGSELGALGDEALSTLTREDIAAGARGVFTAAAKLLGRSEDGAAECAARCNGAEATEGNADDAAQADAAATDTTSTVANTLQAAAGAAKQSARRR